MRRSFREGGKVKHETRGTISDLPDHPIDLIRRSLKGETFVNPSERFRCVRSLPQGHVAAVLGTLRIPMMSSTESGMPSTLEERRSVAALGLGVEGEGLGRHGRR